MNELETNADSVNLLITELCRSLAQQNGWSENTAVAKLKSKSFEILLKKSSRPHVYTAVGDEENFEPKRALEIQIFAAKLNANAHPAESAKFAAFEEHLEDIEQEPYFTEGLGRGVLQLLLALQGNVCDEQEVPETRRPELLVPGPFTLHANYQNNRHYPKAKDATATDRLICPAPRFFKGLQEIKSSSNPYLPKFLFDGEPNKLQEIEQKFAATSTPRTDSLAECTFTGMARRLWGASMRVDVRAFRLFGDSREVSGDMKFNAGKSTLPRKETISSVLQPAEPEERRIFSWNWESLGRFGIPCVKPFTSDSSVTLDLQSFQNQTIGSAFEAKILTQQQFLQDLKSLTAGIQSDSFQHDSYVVFSMQAHITVEGILPDTIRNFIVDFLECGTCYKRMQTMIMKRDYKLMFEGFMFKTLCSAIDEYLLTFRQFVFAQQDQHLMAFWKRMKKMMKQIYNLSLTLAIHPNVDASIKPPMGSQFLGYLYREIMRLTERDYITLLVFILKRCCHVYFKHLQKWIFYGLLDDPSNELFICFVDHYRQNTKYFYDKAYFVRKESVPGFFQNFEDQILQCGKYTMLLKAYKPNHPLFDLEYPAISVCLSFDEIQKLEANCAKYYERARELCGKPITMRNIFETRAEHKRKFHQMASQRSRENMEKWSDEQHELALVAAAQKKKRFDELTLQLQDAKQRKVDERRANVELELKFLREAEKVEEHRMLRENINLRKRIEYYQEISDIMQSAAHEGKTKTSQKPHLQVPSGGPLLCQPHTPASTTSTDFESCHGDEDASSEYAECISDDFVQKFEENEGELQQLCKATEQKVLVDKSPLELNSNLEKTSMTESIAAAMIATPLKRSVSDLINSNELPALVLSVLARNRQHALSGANMEFCVKRLDNAVVTGSSGEDADGQRTPPLLTEAQRNKLKVLTQDFSMLRDDVHTKSLPDINLNTLPDSELSELQRNRKRMMQNDPFSEYNKDPLANRTNLNLELNTELARNRRKVLASEFDIVTVQTTTATLAVDVMTPMSTTSDTPITESVTDVNEKKNDFENGNLPCGKTALKLNVELANKQQEHEKETQEKYQKLLIPNTALTQPEVTPECALNTAGLMAKRDGAFSFANERRVKDQQRAAAAEAPIQNESLLHPVVDDLVDACPLRDYSAPYSRCVELIESDFKCATRSPYFRLNMPPSNASSSAQPTETRTSFKQMDLNSMSVITLTEFLQKSVIIPMSIHLELVNNEVMRMFLEDLRVLEHLRSLRHYFFLMDGEFGAIICDGIIGKLEDGASPEKLLNYQILHSILDTALGSSITGHDKNAENLSFIVSDVPDQFDLSSPGVLSNLSLSYRINWPLNLILNPETLEQYANIFKYLIKVRRISWILERAYQILKEAVKTHGKNILKSPQYRHVQQIRHKFYHFVHTLQNHITANALQASWKTFKDELLHAKSMEDIYRKHTIYVKRILFLCMLNRRSVEFFNTIENIFKISLRFYNNLKSREFKIRSADEHFTHSRYEKLANDELEFDKFIKYTIYLGNKIVRHGYQEEIGEFISLINYNQYYVEKAV